jgi:hypothetical protein
MNEPNHNALDMVRAAALRGVHQAQVLYGQMLLDGKSVERNSTAALNWFERAAKGGNVMAINMVGRCLDQGWGVAPSQVLAEKWFRKAAERGLDWGMYNLATLLTLGEGGVPRDKAEAFFWLRQAADLGHAKSINLLGGFYEDGWIVRINRTTARELYRKAAIGGDFRGQFNYARFLLQEGDLLGALHWLRQVPSTATPGFIAKMQDFLGGFRCRQIEDFVSTLSRTPQG